MTDYNNREDFGKCSYDNTWVTAASCEHCKALLEISIPVNIFKLKKEHFDILICEPCLLDIQKRNGIKKSEKIELYWNSVTESQDLQ